MDALRRVGGRPGWLRGRHLKWCFPGTVHKATTVFRSNHSRASCSFFELLVHIGLESQGNKGLSVGLSIEEIPQNVKGEG